VHWLNLFAKFSVTERTAGLVALYDIRPGNGAGPFLQPRCPHGACPHINLWVWVPSCGLGLLPSLSHHITQLQPAVFEHWT